MHLSSYVIFKRSFYSTLSFLRILNTRVKNQKNRSLKIRSKKKEKRKTRLRSEFLGWKSSPFQNRRSSLETPVVRVDTRARAPSRTRTHASFLEYLSTYPPTYLPTYVRTSVAAPVHTRCMSRWPWVTHDGASVRVSERREKQRGRKERRPELKETRRRGREGRSRRSETEMIWYKRGPNRGGWKGAFEEEGGTISWRKKPN